jgi:D-alanyl-D-alanine carboxypeptidase
MRNAISASRLFLLIAVLLPASLACQTLDHQGLESTIDSMVTAFMAENPVPGVAVGVRVGDRFTLKKAFGLADVENRTPVTPQSVFRIASLTKQFTAAAILQLAERRLLAVEDDLSDYLPGFSTRGHHVTIRHLLTHTSGIPNYTGLEAFQERERLDLSHEELTGIVEAKPFDFSPGDELRYSNSGYYLLGMVIEAVSGQTYAEYLQEHVFSPLEMTRSRYCSDRQLIPNRVRGYSIADEELVNAKPISMANPFSAGGLCSTVGDLMRWQEALDRGEVIGEASFQRMTQRATLNDGSETPYGYGLVIADFDGYRKYAFRGGIAGFSSALTYTPALDLTIAVLTNSDSADPVQLEVAIARMIADELTSSPGPS